jgi:hypothetical protein
MVLDKKELDTFQGIHPDGYRVECVLREHLDLCVYDMIGVYICMYDM